MISYPEFNKLAIVSDIKDPKIQVIKELPTSVIVNLLDIVYTVPVDSEKFGNSNDYKAGISWIYMKDGAKFLVSNMVFEKIAVPFIGGETFTTTATTVKKVSNINIFITNSRTVIVSVKRVSVNVSPDPAKPMLQEFYRMLMTNGSQITVNSDTWKKIQEAAVNLK